jgi:hypothetical protein
VADIDDVFMKRKIVSHPFSLKKSSAVHSTPNIKTTTESDQYRAAPNSGFIGVDSPAKLSQVLNNTADTLENGPKRLDPRVVGECACLSVHSY